MASLGPKGKIGFLFKETIDEFSSVQSLADAAAGGGGEEQLLLRESCGEGEAQAEGEPGGRAVAAARCLEFEDKEVSGVLPGGRQVAAVRHCEL